MANPLLSEIELFMAAHGLSQWQFGEQAMGDRRFVKELRAGREIRTKSVRRVRDFMLTYGSQKEAA